MMKIKDLVTVIDSRDTDTCLHFYFGQQINGIWKREGRSDVICQGYTGLIDAIQKKRIQKYMDVFHMWLEAGNDLVNGEDFPVLWIGVSRKPVLETTEEN